MFSASVPLLMLFPLQADLPLPSPVQCFHFQLTEELAEASLLKSAFPWSLQPLALLRNPLCFHSTCTFCAYFCSCTLFISVFIFPVKLQVPQEYGLCIIHLCICSARHKIDIDKCRADLSGSTWPWWPIPPPPCVFSHVCLFLLVFLSGSSSSPHP